MALAKEFRVGIVEGENLISLAAGASFSSIIETAGTTLCGLYFPTEWTQSEVRFQVSPGNVPPNYQTWFDLIDGNTGLDVSITPLNNQYVDLSVLNFVGVRFIRLFCLTPQTQNVILISSSVPIVQRDFN